jgi:succinate-semialdehyde dehydrogenase/glutarate-semialdehyde dehydrogenase
MNMIEVMNPADGSTVGSVPHHDAQQVRAAIDRACAAFPGWSARLARERADLLRAWFEAVRADRQAFAELICRENGKCLSEALGEIDYGLGFIEWYAEEARRVYGDIIPSHAAHAEVLVLREPIGPVAAITPWNFPFMMITRKVATALAAGCTIIIKPSEETPLTAYKLLEYARRAGIPEGVFEMVTGDPAQIGQAMTDDARIAKISFTGSTPVGRLLARNGAATLKKLTLELGGNAPFIVFDDHDVDQAVAALVAAKLRNSGQVCISPNRIYVQQGIHDAFVAKLDEAVARIRVDQGLQEGFVVGPLINEAALGKVSRLVQQAVGAGATLVRGGKRHARGGLFYEPTILAGVNASMEIRHTEIFGPVFPVYAFTSEAEAIAEANATEYGLVAYAFTRDLGRAFRLSRQLQAGMVILNSGSVGTASVPFGGVKQSGYGREGGFHGIEEYVNVKYSLFAGLGHAT